MARNLVKRIVEKKKKAAKASAKKAKKKTVKNVKKKDKKELDAYNTVRFPLSTEKGVRLMEGENKLIFIVDKKTNKQEVKIAIEKLFKAKVLKVNMLNSTKGLKKAYVKFAPDTPAIDIATNLGLI
jgi:ribosomal protein L23